MAKYQVGDRVGAISHEEEGVSYLFGYGVYEGDKLHPGLGFNNPCIKLDSGALVWGCECWWGPEAEIKAHVANFEKTVEIDIDAERKRWAAEGLTEEPEQVS